MASPAPRILIAEDEARVRQLLRLYLDREGFHTDEAPDGRQALQLFHAGSYDLVILDLMLPEVDGWTVCREIKQAGDTPVMMLSARHDEYDRILGLQLGADDYMGKPFSPRELVLRVQALLRRAGAQPVAAPAERLAAGNVRLAESSWQAWVGSRELRLTRTEFQLLALLLRRPAQVFTREQLLEQVWGYAFTGGRRTVDSHIKNLREKLAGAGATVEIETVWGLGYRLAAPAP